MKMHEFLTEKIVTQPTALGLFLRNRIKLLSKIMAAVATAKDVVHTTEREGEYLVNHALRHLSPEDCPYAPSEYDVDLTQHYHLEDIQRNFSTILQFGPAQFLGHAIGMLKWISPVHENTRKALALMPRVEEGFQDYGYEPGKNYDDDPEYTAARRLADAYMVIWQSLQVVENLIAEIRPVFADMQKRQEFNYRPDQYRPDHEDVEVLYHATLYASQIAADGFSAEKPDDRKGLGNFGDQSLISFTHKLKIAHDIMRGLRDIWMIVHGQITRKTILGWISAEGLDLNRISGLYMSSRLPVESIEQVISLYRGYIGYTKLRADPCFVSPQELIPLMQNADYSDIGIVSCPVQVKDAQYLHGESEFRVPASAVVGPIKRVI